MYKTIIAASFIAFLCSCKPSSKKYGDTLSIIEDKSGDNIKEDEFFSISYTEKTEGGKELGGSGFYDERPELTFRHASDFKGDFNSMVGMLSEGDSAQFKVSIDSLIKTKRPFPADIKGEYLIYNVRINKVIHRKKLSDTAYSDAIDIYRNQAVETEKQRETEKLNHYFSKNGTSFTTTSSGLIYNITAQGAGNKAATNDTVIVDYVATTLNSRAFETTKIAAAKAGNIHDPNITYQPIKVPVAPGKPASGFMEAIRMFPKGTHVTLVIPSKLAYGAGNYKMLEPYTPLICQLEILDIIPQKKQAR